MKPRDLATVAATRAGLASGDARRTLAAAGLTVAEVARALGVSGPAVSTWLSGRTRPTAEHALALGKLLADLAKLDAQAVTVITPTTGPRTARGPSASSVLIDDPIHELTDRMLQL